MVTSIIIDLDGKIGKMDGKVSRVVLCKLWTFKGWFSEKSNLRGGYVQNRLFKGWFSAIWPYIIVTFFF